MSSINTGRGFPLVFGNNNKVLFNDNTILTTMEGSIGYETATDKFYGIAVATDVEGTRKRTLTQSIATQLTSGQTKIATTRVKGAGKDVTQMDAPSEELLELYSAVRGVVLQQDAIGYHRFIKAGSQKNANSVAVRTDKKFTAEQMKKFGTALDKEFGDGHAVIAKEKGVVVINVGDLDNIEFQKRLENLVELNVDDAAHIIYYKNGNLITRDKTDYGKNYKQILGQTRRSDIRQLVRDLLTKKKDLDKEFSEKYSLPFPILADTKGIVATKYDSFGSFVGFKYASRHTFIINPMGKIHKIYKKVNPSSHAQEIINELKNNI